MTHAKKQAKDLTVGKIWKTLLAFSLPIFVSYLLQNLYSMADAAICGQTLSALEVAGVNDTGSIGFMILQFAFGCTAGMSTVLAECIGRHDEKATKKVFATQLKLSVLICIVLTAVGLLALDPLLKLIGIEPTAAQSNNELYRSAHVYMTVIIGGLFAQYMYNFICSTLRSLGDAYVPLLFLIISSALNIGLDLLFIMPCKMGVMGAALATVVSQLVSAGGCFAFALVRYPQLRFAASDLKPDLKFDLKNLERGVPLGLQFSILAFGLIAMSNGIVKFDKDASGTVVAGAPAQNGFSAANKIFNLFTLMPNALATAFMSFVGQNHGAGKVDRIKRGYIQALIIMAISCTVGIGLCFALDVNGAYQYIFLSRDKISAESIKFGRMFLISHLPLIYVLGLLVISRNTLQGLGKPLCPFLAGIAELGARILICTYLPALINGAPIDSTASSGAFLILCFADPIAWTAACLVLVPAAIYNIVMLFKRKNSQKEKTDNTNVAADISAATAATTDEHEDMPPADNKYTDLSEL